MPYQDETAFLESEPPHWVARGLAWAILTLFVVSIAGSILISVPETVSGRFMLVPQQGADPVRALKEGVVSEVRVQEGEQVRRGAVLLVLNSAPLSDRSSELRTLETQRRTDQERLTIAASQQETRLRESVAEDQRLRTKAAFLERLVASKQHRLGQTRQLADSAMVGMRSGSVGRLEATRLDIEVSTLAEEAEIAQNDLDDTRAAIARLARDVEARALEYRETRRGLQENVETAEIRIASLQRALVNLSERGLDVTAPCDGTVLRLRVGAAGAVVSEGEVLSEVACSGSRLVAQFMLPEAGVPRVKAGQVVKLRFDAFPYQRHGIQYGAVRWLGSAGTLGADSNTFRALVDLQTDSIRVLGQPRALLAGMSGRADVVVGRRSLVSYAFEPIRALRENLAEGPDR
jgi:multidrug efflux pump subunit AcrA (membrane-fusion protein)